MRPYASPELLGLMTVEGRIDPRSLSPWGFHRGLHRMLKPVPPDTPDPLQLSQSRLAARVPMGAPGIEPGTSRV